MTHFARELSDAGWYRGLKVPASVLLNIDEKTKKAVSGTGGTYTPSSAIIIGGAGLELQCGALLYGGATVFPAVGKNYQFTDDDYFRFETPLARTIDDSPLLLLGIVTSIPREAMPAIAATGTVTPSLRTRRQGATLRLPLRIPDGARLSGVDVSFKVGVAHANVPTLLPRARVVRIAASGEVTKYPHQSDATADPDGWVPFARPASGAAWYAAGALQTLSLTYDATQSVQDQADRSAYDYALEWTEESGTNAFADVASGEMGNHLVHLKLTVHLPDLRPY